MRQLHPLLRVLMERQQQAEKKPSFFTAPDVAHVAEKIFLDTCIFKDLFVFSAGEYRFNFPGSDESLSFSQNTKALESPDDISVSSPEDRSREILEILTKKYSHFPDAYRYLQKLSISSAYLLDDNFLNAVNYLVDVKKQDPVKVLLQFISLRKRISRILVSSLEYEMITQRGFAVNEVYDLSPEQINVVGLLKGLSPPLEQCKLALMSDLQGRDPSEKNCLYICIEQEGQGDYFIRYKVLDPNGQVRDEKINLIELHSESKALRTVEFSFAITSSFHRGLLEKINKILRARGQNFDIHYGNFELIPELKPDAPYFPNKIYLGIGQVNGEPCFTYQTQEFAGVIFQRDFQNQEASQFRNDNVNSFHAVEKRIFQHALEKGYFLKTLEQLINQMKTVDLYDQLHQKGGELHYLALSKLQKDRPEISLYEMQQEIFNLDAKQLRHYIAPAEIVELFENEKSNSKRVLFYEMYQKFKEFGVTPELICQSFYMHWYMLCFLFNDVLGDYPLDCDEATLQNMSDAAIVNKILAFIMELSPEKCAAVAAKYDLVLTDGVHPLSTIIHKVIRLTTEAQPLVPLAIQPPHYCALHVIQMGMPFSYMNLNFAVIAALKKIYYAEAAVDVNILQDIVKELMLLDVYQQIAVAVYDYAIDVVKDLPLYNIHLLCRLKSFKVPESELTHIAAWLKENSLNVNHTNVDFFVQLILMKFNQGQGPLMPIQKAHRIINDFEPLVIVRIISLKLTTEQLDELNWNKHKILAWVGFWDRGLSWDALVNFSGTFNESHYAVLCSIQGSCDYDEVLAEIAELQQYQVSAMVAGLSREEVVDLNSNQVQVMLELARFKASTYEERLAWVGVIKTLTHVDQAEIIVLKRLIEDSGFSVGGALRDLQRRQQSFGPVASHARMWGQKRPNESDDEDSNKRRNVPDPRL